MKITVLLFGALMAVASSALAVDLQWSGRYRIEGNYIKNPTLNTDQNFEKSYMLHHLILEPKIVPQDGITIKARFDIFNNDQARTQAGQVLGSFSGTPATDGTSAVTTRTQNDETLAVTELYGTWVNEFGGFIVGRMPVQFGLGVTHSAGSGAFDHFHDTKDVVLYRMVLGNLSITPGIAKVREGALHLEDDVNEFLVDATYEDPERDLKMGFLFDHRTAPMPNDNSTRAGDGSGNDSLVNPTCVPTGTSLIGTGYMGDCGSYIADGFNVYVMNFFVQRKIEALSFGVEAGFQNGYTGVKTSRDERVEVAGWGVATEINYKPGNTGISLKAGIASGDDPDTARIESYFFNRNYDIAMLMFNHVLGSRDVVGSALTGSQYVANPAKPTRGDRGVGGIDNEVITNAIYAAPTLTYSASEKWDWLATLAWATQQKQTFPTSQGSADKNLGFETDFGWRYHPTERFLMAMDLGILFPGAAWKGANGAGSASIAYGLTTKAAVSF